MYHALVFVHVVSAVLAVGANATYAVWMARASTAREHLLFALKGVKLIDDRIANPAYVLLLLTGVAQVVISHRSWNEAWIEWTLGLYAVLVAVGLGLYSPALARQIRLVEQDGPDAATTHTAENAQTALGVLLILVVLAILGLMVFRPGGS